MRQFLHRAVLGVALIAIPAVDLLGCGDKYLGVGRGGRYQRGYVSLHPVKILVLESRVTGRHNFLSPLKIAGHRLTVTKDAAKVNELLRTGKFDVVLADYHDATTIESMIDLQSTNRKPMFLPVIDEASRLADMDLKRYTCVLNTKSAKKRKSFLIALDDAVEARLKAQPVSCDTAL